MCFRGLDGVDATANEKSESEVFGFGRLWLPYVDAELMCAVRPIDNKVCDMYDIGLRGTPMM